MNPNRYRDLTVNQATVGSNPTMRATHKLTGYTMTKTVSKISDKLKVVNESFTVNMYDNGYMIEIGGKDSKDDWKTAKITVAELDSLIALIKEAVSMERDN